MTRTGYFLVLCSASMTVGANLLIRAGLDRSGGFGKDGVLVGLARLASQPLFDIGFLLYGIAALVWFRVVSSEPLSVAYPMLVSITFVFVTVGAGLIFQEPISWRKALGLTIIILGIFVTASE